MYFEAEVLGIFFTYTKKISSKNPILTRTHTHTNKHGLIH